MGDRKLPLAARDPRLLSDSLDKICNISAALKGHSRLVEMAHCLRVLTGSSAGLAKQ